MKLNFLLIQIILSLLPDFHNSVICFDINSVLARKQRKHPFVLHVQNSLTFEVKESLWAFEIAELKALLQCTCCYETLCTKSLLQDQYLNQDVLAVVGQDID